MNADHNPEDVKVWISVDDKIKDEVFLAEIRQQFGAVSPHLKLSAEYHILDISIHLSNIIEGAVASAIVYGLTRIPWKKFSNSLIRFCSRLSEKYKIHLSLKFEVKRSNLHPAEIIIITAQPTEQVLENFETMHAKFLAQEVDSIDFRVIDSVTFQEYKGTIHKLWEVDRIGHVHEYNRLVE